MNGAHSTHLLSQLLLCLCGRIRRLLLLPLAFLFLLHALEFGHEAAIVGEGHLAVAGEATVVFSAL